VSGLGFKWHEEWLSQKPSAGPGRRGACPGHCGGGGPEAEEDCVGSSHCAPETSTAQEAASSAHGSAAELRRGGAHPPTPTTAAMARDNMLASHHPHSHAPLLSRPQEPARCVLTWALSKEEKQEQLTSFESEPHARPCPTPGVGFQGAPSHPPPHLSSSCTERQGCTMGRVYSGIVQSCNTRGRRRAGG